MDSASSAQLSQLSAVLESQKMLVKLTAECFEACVPAPGRDLSNSQQSCLWRCAQNSLESGMFMQKRLMSRAAQENQQDHANH